MVTITPLNGFSSGSFTTPKTAPVPPDGVGSGDGKGGNDGEGNGCNVGVGKGGSDGVGKGGNVGVGNGGNDGVGKRSVVANVVNEVMLVGVGVEVVCDLMLVWNFR